MGSRAPAVAFVGLTVTMLIALPSFAPTAARAGVGTLVVRGGTLVDGTGREPLRGATIVVRDGRVAEVTADHVAGLPADTEVVDARGKWIVPGLIDMHVHYQPAWMDPLFLRHGVTTVRDVGSGLNHILERREENRPPGVARPRIFACGPLIDGPWPRHGTGISVSVQTVTEARAAARQLLDRGVDCLKIYEQLTPPLVEAVVREADGTRVPVTAHLRDTTALQALEIGVRGLEHAFGFDACDQSVAAQVVRRVVERGAYVVPTLAVTEQVSRLGSPEQETMALLGEIPAARRQYWRAMAAGTPLDRTAGAARRLGCLKPFVARLQRAGGQVVAGSDTSNRYVIPGASLHRDLMLGPEGEGFLALLNGLDADRFWGRFYKAPALERLLRQLVEYANTTVARGAPLARDAALRRRLAEMAVDLAALRLTFYRVACLMRDGAPITYETAVAKVMADETGQKLARLGMDLLGLWGPLAEGSRWAKLGGQISRQYLTSLGHTIAGGTAEILRTTVAVRGLGLPPEPKGH